MSLDLYDGSTVYVALIKGDYGWEIVGVFADGADAYALLEKEYSDIDYWSVEDWTVQ